MKESLYRDLTLEDKINLLRYERGSIALVSLEQYESTDNNPTITPTVSDLYISSVLGFDWGEAREEPNFKVKVKAAYEAVREAALPYASDHRSMHVADALGDVFYILTHPDENKPIDEDLVNTIDDHIKRIYSVFDSFDSKYELIPDTLINNEPIYRRIK